MTSLQQDRNFKEAVIPDSLLEQAIAWISSSLSPEDVFTDKQLAEWATTNGYTEKTE